MTREEFIDEVLGLIKEIEDDHSETTFLVGYINEQMLTSDFEVPLEELMAILREYKPHIYLHMKITSSGDFRKLLNTEMTAEEALKRLGKETF
ncbi:MULTISPECIES: hypothetical protein [Tepidibacillus]|uniref:Uncharacterized protein n=1 Tax=Tepidibacillus fermentans TaxID=1281767 RepID=A0A4R3K937_9BACI|nr:hypothetical protein [Tepidibacillus fermentans]TCS79405.1 hypothetical protein EDD72_12130 [Tepidibacillus fermentans]